MIPADYAGRIKRVLPSTRKYGSSGGVNIPVAVLFGAAIPGKESVFTGQTFPWVQS
jgi:hypothetical protein